MSIVSDSLGAHGAPITFDHRGRTYAVPHVTQQTKSQVERWLRKLVYDDLYASRQDMPAEQYEHAMALAQRNRTQYAYLGPLYWATVATPDGMAGLVAILFGTTEADAKNLLAERGPDVDALVSEVTLASMPREQAEEMRRRIAAVSAGQSEAREGPDPTPAAGPVPTPTSAPSTPA